MRAASQQEEVAKAENGEQQNNREHNQRDKQHRGYAAAFACSVGADLRSLRRCRDANIEQLNARRRGADCSRTHVA